MSTLIDSYSESNYTHGYVCTDVGHIQVIGQTFTGIKDYKLTSAKFYLENWNSATGDVSILLYAHTGTFGTDGEPTGPLLATSDSIDVSTISSSYELVEFTFSGENEYVLEDASYCIAVYYNEGTYNANIDLAVGLAVGFDITGSAEGNLFGFEIDWFTNGTYDTCFYVYGEPVGPTIGEKYPLPAFGV